MTVCEYSADGVILLTEGKDSSDNKETEENVWYLDNGTSNHMTGLQKKFEKLDRTVNGQLKFGDKSLVKIEGKWLFRIACKKRDQSTRWSIFYPHSS